MDFAAFAADPTVAAVIVGAIALILITAAWHKLAEPNAFLAALAGYRLVPAALLNTTARALPGIEIALAVGALVPATRPGTLLAIAALFVLYAAAMAVNLLRGRSYIDCGCGGAAHPLSWGLIGRNAVLAGLAVLASRPSLERAWGWLDSVTLIFGALACFAAYLATDELLRQAGRMARAREGAPQESAT